ncbi:hypothetical protein [Stenotrophomonas maltophilia]|uniref:hypothetical protein n=1 Tax=Stenotrophomonas maltophilia TaxID=40324 RepID=UPI0021C8250D|nr:hypothetical protein [Stenotrophomonas maltophilia]MCU1138452.1 hypothetical protein [Stenotrophomonas maltophilia]
MSTNKKLEALSAQPSPGGQGDLKSRFTEWVKANSYNPATFASGRFIGDGVQIAWEAVQALAARKPVGEPVGQVRTRADGGFIAELFPGVADRVSNLAPLYAAPPAQAVDLGQFRPAVELMEWQERGHANPDFPSGDAKKHAEALRLLALIDSKAVGNGPSGVPA